MPRIIEPFQQFFNSAGKPNSGGKLFFYETGSSTTEKNTYSDSSESIPNTNPLILDGDGRCPDAWGTGTYRVLVTDKNDVQIDARDPVGGSGDSGIFQKNILLGNFFVNQRDVSGTVVLAAGEYGHDRYRAGADGCTYTFVESGGITTVTIISGSLEQEVFAVNILPGNHVLSWQGNAMGRIDGGDYGLSGEVAKELTGAVNAEVEFNTGTLSLPQLEKGSFSTPYEFRGERELYLCWPYAFRLDSDGTFNIGLAQGITFNDALFHINFPFVAINDSPTFTSSGAATIRWSSGSQGGAITLDFASDRSALIEIATSNSNILANECYRVTSTGFLLFDWDI